MLLLSLAESYLETWTSWPTERAARWTAVPEWIKQPYRLTTEDEEGHGSVPRSFLRHYATTEDRQDRARRAVAMRMVLFREYLSSLDRWVMGKASW
jgi:hypothetical protein